MSESEKKKDNPDNSKPLTLQEKLRKLWENGEILPPVLEEISHHRHQSRRGPGEKKRKLPKKKRYKKQSN